MAEGRPVVGAQVRLPFTVTDATGTLVDAATQAVAVTLPDGTTSTPVVVHDSTGNYHADFTVTLPGRHDWYATTTAPATRTPVNVFNAGSETLGPIVGLTEIRNHFNVSSTASDSELLNFAMRGSAAVENYTGQVFRRHTFTETYSGGKTAIILRNGPAQSFTSVVESGRALSAGDYVFDPNSWVLTRGSTAAPINWIYGVQNISVTYVAVPPGGIVPDDVIHSTLEEIRHLWETQRGGSNRPRQQSSDTVYDPRSGYTWPRAVTELLNNYLAPGIA